MNSQIMPRKAQANLCKNGACSVCDLQRLYLRLRHKSTIWEAEMDNRAKFDLEGESKVQFSMLEFEPQVLIEANSRKVHFPYMQV